MKERFVRRLIAERRIAYCKVGGRAVRIAESDIEAFVVAGRVGTTRLIDNVSLLLTSTRVG